MAPWLSTFRLNNRANSTKGTDSLVDIVVVVQFFTNETYYRLELRATAGADVGVLAASMIWPIKTKKPYPFNVR